jgi:hypothetical protein
LEHYLFNRKALKKLIYLLVLISIQVTVSCNKDQISPAMPPNPPVPNVTDTNTIDSSVTLSSQTWVLTAYRIGEFGGQIFRNDTLNFLSISDYSYNNTNSTYSIYPAMASYNLTLNGTFLGNLSGSVYDYNLTNGVVDGLRFQDITTGGSSQYYYLWMHKL